MQVKLEQIIEVIELQSEENRSYLNLKTGEFVSVSRGALHTPLAPFLINRALGIHTFIDAIYRTIIEAYCKG